MNTAALVCSYPQCNCPFDAPADPNWCARGLPRTLTQQQGGDGLPPVHIMRAAFVTADENYSGKRVAAVYADASMIGQRVHLIPVNALRTQQPAASEGDGHYCNPVAFFNGAACPECFNKHYLPTANTSKQAVATDECGRPLTYWGGKAPPRHPADGAT